MIRTTQFEIEVSWGKLAGQIFGNKNNPIPIVALHGFLDNSNSFRPLASQLVKNDKYYLIALDLPGMGLSSKIPGGIPYSTKFYVMNLRRLTQHFNLHKFVFLTHSFGCSLALAYSACYPEQVLSLVMIDFAMKDCNIDNRDNIGECWKDGIETYLRAEKMFKGKGNQTAPKKELTYDFALNRLLESNKHIDEINGKILLERGLIYENEKLDYSRDITLVTGMSIRDYHREFHGIFDSLYKTLNSPVCLLYATPAPFGQELFDQIMKIMSEIKKNSKSLVDLVPVEGTHHFHMLKPELTAELIFDFLENKIKLIESINNNHKAASNETNCKEIKANNTGEKPVKA